jgi:hypothetical protein
MIKFRGVPATPARITCRAFYRSRKKWESQMIEQRYVIKFVAEEGDTGIQVHHRLMEHYGNRAMSRSEGYRWIRHIKGGRTDLETLPSPGWTPNEGLADVIRCRIEEDSNFSVRKIAHSRDIVTSTVCHYLQNVLGMKCCHVRWIPVVKGNVSLFEAPGPTPDPGATNSCLSKDSSKFSMTRFVLLPLHEKEFHHASLLMFLDLGPVNVSVDIVMKRSVRD